MDYLAVRQTAEKWGVTERWVQALIKRGSIEGVVRFGHAWMIPKDAQKPADGRKDNRRRPRKENAAQIKTGERTMYSIALCEDEEVFSKAQEKLCREILEKLNIEHHIAVFKSGDDFLSAFSGGGKRFDLILLDIIMDGIDGMELARRIRETDCEAVIIFITSSREYVFEGYDVNALHYLTKPVDEAVLERLIKTAYKDKFQESFLVFKSDALNQRVAIKDIISLETTGRQVEIMLTDRTLHYPGRLTELLDQLPKDCFVRCHQAFAVNIKNVQELTRSDAIAINGKKIPVSRAYLKDVRDAFLANMQGI